MSAHLTCSECGVVFCLPDHMAAARREDHEGFYCPNGHEQYFPAETAKERTIRELRRRVESFQRRLDARDKRIDALEHEVRSLRSRLAWAKRRVA